MLLNSETLVSMREANQNFSKVARLVEEKGSVVIMKNNKPHFVLMSFDEMQQQELDQSQVSDDEVMELTKHFTKR